MNIKFINNCFIQLQISRVNKKDQFTIEKFTSKNSLSNDLYKLVANDIIILFFFLMSANY